MKGITIILISCTLCLAAFSQTQQYISIDTSAANEKYWAWWLKDLYDVGVVMDKDSIKINDEAKKIILDSNFRKLIYPASYTWEAAISLLNKLELKKGFWYLINLYSTDTVHKNLVLQSLLSFDKLMDMEKVVVSTFYTYALLNPKICTISNGRPVITKPDIVEKQFNKVKEIVSYIAYYRKQQKNG